MFHKPLVNENMAKSDNMSDMNDMNSLSPR